MSTDLLFATGGSGGHIYPALSLAARLCKRGLSTEFIGQSGGMEEELVAAAGFPFHGVAAGKLDRQRPDLRQLFTSLRGQFQALGLLRRLRPRLVVGFGGFASLPGAAAAVLSGTPLVLHEQNAFPGLVTRLLGRFARVVVISHPEARPRLRARQFREIAYPVREERANRAVARAALGLPEQGLVTLVLGGSQGSAALNDAVLAALRTFGAAAPLTLHATGQAHEHAVRQAAEGIPGHHPVGYVDAVLAWSAADLAITRAGTGTLSEAAFHGVPLIMVPLPSSAEDHQLHNARAVAAAGAGTLLRQAELSRLPQVWRELLEPSARHTAAAAATKRSPAGASEEFAQLLNALLPDGTAPASQEIA